MGRKEEKIREFEMNRNIKVTSKVYIESSCPNQIILSP